MSSKFVNVTEWLDGTPHRGTKWNSECVPVTLRLFRFNARRMEQKRSNKQLEPSICPDLQHTRMSRHGTNVLISAGVPSVTAFVVFLSLSWRML